jgi:hypothetical protein
MKLLIRRSAIAVGLAAAFLTAGCAHDSIANRITYTDGLASEYQLTEPHKRALQYYTSRDIILARSASSNLRGVGDGMLIERGNTRIQDVRIAAGTPGVVVGSGPNWLAVSFEPGTHLYFVSSQHRINSPYWWDGRGGDRYYLYAPDWDGRAGSVRLGNASYQAVEGSIDAFLLVDQESLYSAEGSTTRQDGRWLPGITRRY